MPHGLALIGDILVVIVGEVRDCAALLYASLPRLTLLPLGIMTQKQLIKLHDHLVAHYNAHGAEEAREQICFLENLPLVSIASSPSPGQ